MGNYAVTFVNGLFTIMDKDEPEPEPTPTPPTPTPTPTPAVTPPTPVPAPTPVVKTTEPQTGDDYNSSLWVMLMMMATGVMGAIGFKRKRETY